MRATAAVLRAFGQPLALEDVEIPVLQPGQALVEIEAAGVCGSDVHMWRGHDPRTPMPIILGHEGVGRVVELNGTRLNVNGAPVKPGDRLLWERGVACGQCHACAVLGEPALCSQRWVYGIYRSLDVPPHLNGCYASHIILDPRTQLFPLDDAEAPDVFVSASCSGATATHGFALSPAHIGDTVAILGPGPLGAFSVALAAASGAQQIVLIGGSEQRMALCRPLGASVLLNRRTSTPEARRAALLDLTGGRGVDLAVEAAGSVEAASEALALLRPGGALSLVGFGTPVGEWSLLPFETLVRKNVRVQGVWVSDPRHTAQAIALVRQKQQAFAHLVTHRFSLADATHALEAVASREAMKVVLLPGLP